MTKKTMSQNEKYHMETYSTSITSTDDSHNPIQIQKVSIDKAKIEYNYYT